MPELDRELQALAAHLEWPETPPLGTRVRAHLGERESRRGRPWRLAAAVALAAALAVGVAFAVPQSRAAILRWFGFGGVRIEFVDRLPPVPPQGPLELGPRVSLDAASRRAGFEVLTSPLLGPPDEAHFDGVQVWLVYGGLDSPRALLSEFRGRTDVGFVKKIASSRTRVEFVTVAGEPGVFISGADHFLYMAPTTLVRDERLRLARNTLLWQRGPLTLRLEGGFGKAQALAIAGSVEQ